MRRLTVLIAAAALAAWASDAAFAEVPVLLRTPGAQGFELENGNGRAVVTGRGAILLTMRRGRLRIVDLPRGGSPALSDKCRQRARRVSPTTVQIRGRNIGCVISSGPNGSRWQAIMRGRGISASGRVNGSVTLDGADRGPVGRYRIGGGAWRDWPRVVDTFGLRR